MTKGTELSRWGAASIETKAPKINSAIMDEQSKDVILLKSSVLGRKSKLILRKEARDWYEKVEDPRQSLYCNL